MRSRSSENISTAVQIAMVGMGAANMATYRLLVASIEERQDEFCDKWRVCQESNADDVMGGINEALRGADVCIAFSTPDPELIKPQWVEGIAREAIVFACANPLPEIWPRDAKEAGARIVGTGRSDFANQVNNSLGFPGIFRGVLDVRARTITDEMAIAAALELARCAEERGLSPDNILPTMDEWDVAPRIAIATAMKAEEQGVAKLSKSREELYATAIHTIQTAREATHLLMNKGIIEKPPSTYSL